MSAETASHDFDPGQTVVLNALVDMYAEESIVLDDASRGNLESVVEANTTPEQRSAIEREFGRLAVLEEGDSAEITAELADFVETVTRGLAESGYSVSVNHEYRQELSAFDACVYSFLNTGDDDHLDPLDLTPEVKEALMAGINLLESDDQGRAVSKFSTALELASTHTDQLASRVVAAWGSFYAGDDETASEHVEHAYDLDDTSWVVQIVAACVKRNERENDLIRSRTKLVGLVLRWVTNGSENTSTRAEIGVPDDEGGVTWEAIDHKRGHAYLDRVYPTTRIRFELQGDLPEFPGFQVYYLAVGLYETEMDYIEKVLERFGSGPNNADSVERISIVRADE